jgi:hypothetical protein
LLPKPCLICGVPSDGPRCAKHRDRDRHGGMRRGERGYGPDYDRERRELARRVASALASGARVTCVICHRPITSMDAFSAEHVRPLRAGGGAKGNLAPAHKRCNYGWRRKRH